MIATLTLTAIKEGVVHTIDTLRIDSDSPLGETLLALRRWPEVIMYKDEAYTLEGDFTGSNATYTKSTFLNLVEGSGLVK